MPGVMLAFAAVGYVAGAILGLGAPKRVATALACTFAAAASALVLVAGVALVLGALFSAVRIDTGLPLGALILGADPLSGMFLAVIGLVGGAAAIYAIDYLRPHARGPQIRATLAVFNVLLLSLVGIVVAADGVAFLIGWEIMAALSYLAVLSEHDDPEVCRAAYLMIAVSELGTVAIAIAIVLLAHAGGGFAFDRLHAGAGALSPVVRDGVYVLSLFGFGAKIGILPLQLWLPEAHPAAPSHISALLSAVIVKLGIYGFIRFGIAILGPVAAWLGMGTLVLAALTALGGVLFAMSARDCKRLLAYSTIENVGIILAALGLAVLFRGDALPQLAALALLFGFYHVLGHATYKGLLFLGSGAIAEGAGTRDLELLGGLIRRMPWTALCCLVGALSIAALPPFAGFVSEWGLLETLLQSFPLGNGFVSLLLGLVTALIALAAALGVMAFVRFYASAFLALPRSARAAAARESGPSMRIALGLLAFAAILLGTLPTFVLTALDRVGTPIIGVSIVDRVVPPVFTDYPGEYAPLVGLGGGAFRGLHLPVRGLIVIPAPHFATIGSPTYLTLALLIALAILWLVLRAIKPLGERRIAPVWAGGIPHFGPRNEYGPLAYANPVRMIFGIIYRSRVSYEPLDLAARGGTGTIVYRQEIPEPLWRTLYRPLLAAGDALTARIRRLQSGSVNAYVFYIFLIVLITLVLRTF